MNNERCLEKICHIFLQKLKVGYFCGIDLEAAHLTTLLSSENDFFKTGFTDLFLIFKNGPIPASFCLFSSFPHYTIEI